MIAKPLFLIALLTGTSSAFAVVQPGSVIATVGLSKSSTTAANILRMNGGAAAGADTPELKVRRNNNMRCMFVCLFVCFFLSFFIYLCVYSILKKSFLTANDLLLQMNTNYAISNDPQPPAALYQGAVAAGVAKASKSWIDIFKLGIVSGCHIAFGAYLAITVGG